MKLKAKIQYNGLAFSGWQMQIEGVKTIQGDLKRTLEVLTKSQFGKEDFKHNLIGSGRTDAGVHARAQVASFNWPELADSKLIDCEKLRHEINGVSDNNLMVDSLEVVGEDFCARRNPHTKTYCYYFYNSRNKPVLLRERAWWISKPMDFKSMLSAAKYFKGTKDFSAFRASDCGAKTTIRTVKKVELVKVDQNLLVLLVEGKGFLKNMIRIIAGTIAEVGKGKRDFNEIEKILESKDRTKAGITAPAYGLFLDQVIYEE